jgi:glucose/arabinose dehydrogenase
MSTPVPALVVLLLVTPIARAFAGDPTIEPVFAGELLIESLTPDGGDGGRVTQMAWGPPGPAGELRLYLSTHDNGVHRFDYDPDGPLTNATQVSTVPALGLAFHDEPALAGAGGAVLYLSEFNGSGTLAVLRRVADDDGDGQWGEPGELDQTLVDNIPLGNDPYGHHVNQIQIDGDTLFVGIGVGSDLGDNENAYTGTVSWIEDLTLLAGDTTTPDVAGLGIVDYNTDPAPFTSTAPDRLRVHSSGTRNPFGLALDGDGRLWVTVNQIDQPRPGTGETSEPQDQLYLAFEHADYAYEDGLVLLAENDVTDWRNHPLVLAAGFYDPTGKAVSRTRDLPDPSYMAADPGASTGASSGLPHGLGPHSSADGFDFYDGNGLSLRWHKDAFVARQSGQVPPPLGPFEDLAAVDLDTGEVDRVASGFSGPLDVLADERGNLLVGEVGFPGAIRRVRPVRPITSSHRFAWGTDSGGAWSDRLAWLSDHDADGVLLSTQPAATRKMPHAWGTARYDVTIDRRRRSSHGSVGGASVEWLPEFEPWPLVRVDRDVRIEHLTLGDRLQVLSGNTLTVTQGAMLEAGSQLLGDGVVEALVQGQGVVAPGAPGAIGLLTFGNNVDLSGELHLQLASSGTFDRMIIQGQVALSGTVVVTLTGGFVPVIGTTFDAVIAGQILDTGLVVIGDGSFAATVVDLGPGLQALRLTAL